MQKKHKQLMFYGVIAVAMFGFSYALVPTYNVMCHVLEINGKTSMLVSKNTSWVDKSRTIMMQFLATNNTNLK